MLLCRDEAARGPCAATCRTFCHGTERRFLHRELGHNYRMSALEAASRTLTAFERLGDILATKRRLAETYRERLSQIEEWVPQKVAHDAQPSNWMIAGVIDDRVSGDASDLAAALLRRGVDTRPFFLGMQEQPALRGYVDDVRLPVTERLSMRRGLYLPSGLDLDEEAVGYVATALAESIAELGRRSRSLPSGRSRRDAFGTRRPTPSARSTPKRTTRFLREQGLRGRNIGPSELLRKICRNPGSSRSRPGLRNGSPRARARAGSVSTWWGWTGSEGHASRSRGSGFPRRALRPWRRRGRGCGRDIRRRADDVRGPELSDDGRRITLRSLDGASSPGAGRALPGRHLVRRFGRARHAANDPSRNAWRGRMGAHRRVLHRDPVEQRVEARYTLVRREAGCRGRGARDPRSALFSPVRARSGAPAKPDDPAPHRHVRRSRARSPAGRAVCARRRAGVVTVSRLSEIPGGGFDERSWPARALLSGSCFS